MAVTQTLLFLHSISVARQQFYTLVTTYPYTGCTAKFSEIGINSKHIIHQHLHHKM